MANPGTPGNESAAQITINDLIRMSGEGNQNAFERLLSQLHDLIISVIRSTIQGIHREDIEDAHGELQYKLWEWCQDPNSAKVLNPIAYICRMARNQAVSQVRKNNTGILRGHCSFDDFSDPTSFAQSNDAVPEFENSEFLEWILNELEEPDRTIVCLRLEGATLHEIAEQVGLPVSTVYERVHAGFEKIAQRWNAL